MFRSIFSKLLAAFISIVIFSFSIAGLTLFYFLDNYVSDETTKSLEQKADEIDNYFKIYLQNRDNPLSRMWLENMLYSYTTKSGVLIWIINPEGLILYPASSSISYEIMKNMGYDEDGHVKLPDERQYKKVTSGQKGVITEKGNFYGLFKGTGWSWLTVEKPLITTGNSDISSGGSNNGSNENGNGSINGGSNNGSNNNNGGSNNGGSENNDDSSIDSTEKVIGAIYLHIPISELQKTRTSVFRYFLFSTIVAILFSIILVYIFSLRISKPLKKINNTARIIAGGEFGKRLDIKSNDEIGELAKSFNQMITDLENVEEMRKGFIANVSHELRTPMTSVRGFIEGILDGTIPPEKQNDYLKIVRDETNRLNRLVNNLLDLAKMEAGEMKLSLRNFNINELIRCSIIKMEKMIVEKNIDIEADFDEEELYVKADPDAIERVIINLVHNAVKFSPESGFIIIRTYTQKDKVYVYVQDNGPGIEKEELNNIWQRFYKSDKSRGIDKSGTGLGLAIVRNIINEHQQEIWVESEPGKGSKFIFTLEKGDNDDGKAYLTVYS